MQDVLIVLFSLHLSGVSSSVWWGTALEAFISATRRPHGGARDTDKSSPAQSQGLLFFAQTPAEGRAPALGAGPCRGLAWGQKEGCWTGAGRTKITPPGKKLPTHDHGLSAGPPGESTGVPRSSRHNPTPSLGQPAPTSSLFPKYPSISPTPLCRPQESKDVVDYCLVFSAQHKLHKH